MPYPDVQRRSRRGRLVYGGGSGQALCYSPLASSYSSANFATAVTVPNTDTITIHVTGMDNLPSLKYLLGSSGSALVYFRGNDNRVRIVDDSGSIRQFNLPGINLGGENKIDIELTPTRVNFSLNDEFVGFADGPVGTCTFDCAGARNNTGLSTLGVGAVYGIVLGGQAAWPMQSDRQTVFDGADEIGSNDLTFLGTPNPITESDTVETTCL